MRSNTCRVRIAFSSTTGRARREPVLAKLRRSATKTHFTFGVAHPLQSLGPMPRKQRFKPSRKPKPDQATVSNPQVDDRKETQPSEAQDIERQAPVEQAPRDIEGERG